QILGVASPVTIELYDGYLANGLDANAGVYAKITSPNATVTFSADKSGGLATPNLSMTGLSARKGLIAGNPDDAASGVIRPSEFFGDTSAQLFGTIPLGSLIPVDNEVADAAQNAPEIRSKLLPDAKATTSIVTHIKWQPALQNYSLDPLDVEFDASSSLTLEVTLTRGVSGGPASSQAVGELKSFHLTFKRVI